jgi:hypothetical protein
VIRFSLFHGLANGVVNARCACAQNRTPTARLPTREAHNTLERHRSRDGTFAAEEIPGAARAMNERSFGDRSTATAI